MAPAAAMTPTATMIPAAGAWNVCTGTRPMWRNGVRSIIHFGMPITEPTRYQRKAAVDESVGDCRARTRCDRIRKGSDTQEQKRDGYAVGAGFEHSWERDVDPLGCCTRPGEQAGKHRQDGGGEQRRSATARRTSGVGSTGRANSVSNRSSASSSRAAPICEQTNRQTARMTTMNTNAR